MMQIYTKNKAAEIIVFDLDGTLYPRAIYMQTYYDFTLSALCELKSLTLEEAESIMNKHGIFRNPVTEQGSVSSLMAKMGVSLAEWNRYRDERFDMSLLVSRNPILRKVIKKLSRKFRLVLITNNTAFMARRILDRIGIELSVFSLVITSDNGVSLKPDPENFAHVARVFDSDFSAMLSIGDRYLVDVEPVLTLGGNGVVVDGPDELVEFALDYLLEDSTTTKHEYVREKDN